MASESLNYIQVIKRDELRKIIQHFRFLLYADNSSSERQVN